MTRIERYDARRQRILRHYLAGFAVWGGVLALLFLGVEWLSRSLLMGLAAVGVAGWLYWLLYLWRLLQLGRELRADPATAAALNDEFTRAAQSRALQMGFWAMLVVQGVLVVLLVLNVPMSPMFAPVATIVVGVVTALGYGLRLEQG